MTTGDAEAGEESKEGTPEVDGEEGGEGSARDVTFRSKVGQIVSK